MLQTCCTENLQYEECMKLLVLWVAVQVPRIVLYVTENCNIMTSLLVFK